MPTPADHSPTVAPELELAAEALADLSEDDLERMTRGHTPDSRGCCIGHQDVQRTWPCFGVQVADEVRRRRHGSAGRVIRRAG